ncbi:MAG: lipocalin-like domain-containing protein [Tannerellaceae bacterium]|jgi:hypothetical protein|nr:lipocalin-like domain-containing protein [Tannerellaceae bacterium]
MKKKNILYCLIFIWLASSCYKASMNGKLDGMWQLMEIDKAGGECVDTKQERRYYSIQLRLLSLRKADGYQFLGRFVYTGDSLWIHDVRIYQAEDRPASKEQLLPFGISDLSERFKVETITHEQMILKSEYATLRFRKF